MHSNSVQPLAEDAVVQPSVLHLHLQDCFAHGTEHFVA
jgi:hypothetical protein